MKKNLLLHICCAPCSASCVKMLQDEYNISFYWYNPNIYDTKEYEMRKDSAIRYAKELNINFFEIKDFKYDSQLWKQKSLLQCFNCYDIRLNSLVKFAKQNNFENFSTSLLSSPYQKHDLIKQISQKLARENNLNFIYKDFRPKYYEGKNELGLKGYYMQKYCGCEKSYNERLERLKLREQKK